MAFTRKNDEAVSPVIGVILMVAVTVILAAVIAAFVFGMAGNVSKSKVVAITASKVSGTIITATNQGGQDAGSLSAVNVSTVPAATSATPYLATGVGYMYGSPSVAVGCRTTLTGTYSSRTEVIAIGYFNDGSQQVLLDTFV